MSGRNGADGAPGKDGRDGIPGKDGSPGKNGKDGKDGIRIRSKTVQVVHLQSYISISNLEK